MGSVLTFTLLKFVHTKAPQSSGLTVKSKSPAGQPVLPHGLSTSALSFALNARQNAPTHSVGAAVLQGCSDANAGTPLPGSGIATIRYSQD